MWTGDRKHLNIYRASLSPQLITGERVVSAFGSFHIHTRLYQPFLEFHEREKRKGKVPCCKLGAMHGSAGTVLNTYIPPLA